MKYGCDITDFFFLSYHHRTLNVDIIEYEFAQKSIENLQLPKTYQAIYRYLLLVLKRLISLNVMLLKLMQLKTNACN